MSPTIHTPSKALDTPSTKDNSGAITRTIAHVTSSTYGGLSYTSSQPSFGSILTNSGVGADKLQSIFDFLTKRNPLEDTYAFEVITPEGLKEKLIQLYDEYLSDMKKGVPFVTLEDSDFETISRAYFSEANNPHPANIQLH